LIAFCPVGQSGPGAVIQLLEIITGRHGQGDAMLIVGMETSTDGSRQ
jgi:hypothetical protein